MIFNYLNVTIVGIRFLCDIRICVPWVKNNNYMEFKWNMFGFRKCNTVTHIKLHCSRRVIYNIFCIFKLPALNYTGFKLIYTVYIDSSAIPGRLFHPFTTRFENKGFLSVGHDLF